MNDTTEKQIRRLQKTTIINLICIALLSFAVVSMAYGAVQKEKAKVAIDAGLATYTINGASLAGETKKKITLIRLKYNEATIPCVVMDGNIGSYSQITAPSISCAWTADIVAAIDKD